MKNIETRLIGEKTIYIFEDHHTALGAWSDYRRRASIKPNLITLDCHTDTIDAFARYIIEQSLSRKPDNFEEMSLRLGRKLDYKDEDNIEKAISILWNDEHIDAAVKAEIINLAFVISYFGYQGTLSIEEERHREISKPIYQNRKMIFPEIEPFNIPIELQNFVIPENRIFEIPARTGFELDQSLNGVEIEVSHCHSAIEKDFLDAKLKMANQMVGTVGIKDILATDYILDIDLDYFRTAKSIAPDNPATFYEMIRRSKTITIALEPNFVTGERLDGEKITSDFLLPKLLDHIQQALS